MPNHLIGAHMTTAGGLHRAVQTGHAIGCTAIQVFTSSPQMWRAKQPTQEAVQAYREAVVETGMGEVISHDSYLVNLAAPGDELREKSIASLTDEMVRCGAYGIHKVVSHIGSHQGQGEEAGLARAAEAMLRVLAESPTEVKLLVETTAGQGTALFWQFEQIARVIELCSADPRLGVCLDTCHVFAAGYDIRDAEGFAGTFAAFDRAIGRDRLLAVHFNDSKKPLGSRVDRHEHIGEGAIGQEAFRLLVNEPSLAAIPIVIETPEADSHHQNNLERLWSMVQGG